MGLLGFLAVAGGVGFAYLVYKNGFDGALAVVSAGAVAVGAYFSGLLDNLF